MDVVSRRQEAWERGGAGGVKRTGQDGWAHNVEGHGRILGGICPVRRLEEGEMKWGATEGEMVDIKRGG